MTPSLPAPAGYRARFHCLWCGTPWESAGPDALEGWAQLCPDCLGRAGTSRFLRDRLHTALRARGSAGSTTTPGTTGSGSAADRARGARPAGEPAMPALPDDWFLRRGVFERGAVHDAAWAAELDMVTRWVDGLGLRGRIEEPAAGVGFFSPLLAERGELHASDPDAAALDRARERLVAHRLLAHLHVADPWRPAAAEPASDPPAGLADAVLAAFLLGRVRGAGLDAAAASLRGRLRPGGRLALVELRSDPAGGPPAGLPWTWHAPAVLEAALVRAGFASVELRPTGRFFLLGLAEAA